MNETDLSSVKSMVTDEGLVKKRRSQIVSAAVELFSHRGYFGTTILDVARKAGVSSGLIYQYVHDKDDVLLLALLSVLDSYKHEIPLALEGVTDPIERFCVAIEAYCRIVDQKREATVLAYRSTKSLPEPRRQLIKASELESNGLIAGCLSDCIDQGLFRPVNVTLLAYQLVMFAHAWALKHWRLKEVFTLDEYVREGVDFYLQALLTTKGRKHYRASHPTDDMPDEE